MIKRLILFLALILLVSVVYFHHHRIQTCLRILYPKAGLPRVLFLGDQTTRGINDPSGFGFRDHVQTLLVPGKWNFVGPYTDPSFHWSFNVNHAAEDWNWAGLVRVRTERLLDKYLNPTATSDWILIYAGMADIFKSLDIKATQMDIQGLIKDITVFNPNIRIVLAKIIPCRNRVYNEKIEILNSWIEEMVRERIKKRDGLEKENNLFVADMYRVFTSVPQWGETLMSTQWYPNEKGYELMAQEWVRVMKEVGGSQSKS